MNPSASTTHNRLVSYTFDNAGNTTVDAEGRTFTYDAENKQTKVVNSQQQTVGEYFYDGDGKRVKKVAGNEVTIFVYDAGGKLVAEYANQIATPTEAKVSYLTSDHLGSPRINTDANGNVTARHDYMPFGEEIGSTQTPQRNINLNYAGDDVRQKFTGYIDDEESGLEFAEARMYANQYGRFTSPDPLLSSGRPVSPQTWNRFTYVLNNPLVLIDPDGLYECKGTSAECATFRQKLADDRAKLADIEKKYGKKSDEYKQSKRALDAYGCESKGGKCVDAGGKKITEKNKKGKEVDVMDKASNVKVSFGYSDAGLTSINTAKTGKDINIQFGTGYESNLGIIGNEGINAADFQDYFRSGRNALEYQSDFDGLLVQAVYGELNAIAEGNDSASFEVNPAGRAAYDVNYWEKGWETPDHATVRAKRKDAINTVLREDQVYGLTPSSKTRVVQVTRRKK